jgi:hypothetical protein
VYLSPGFPWDETSAAGSFSKVVPWGTDMWRVTSL